LATPVTNVAEGAAADVPARPRRLLVLLPLIIFGGLALLFLAGLLGGDRTKLPSALIGQPAPTLALPALEGLQRDGAPVPGFGGPDLRQGKVRLVNVFASWCAPCHAEHPFLMELARDSRIAVLGINQKDVPENARRFLGSKGNPFAAVGIDPTGRASIEWGVYGVPETFIVKGDGTIAFKLVGPLTEANFAAFRAEVEKALR
jgi:cytochrome c biogenesis protein CcmG/thiol:disulfide interchange protein DsbE